MSAIFFNGLVAYGIFTLLWTERVSVGFGLLCLFFLVVFSIKVVICIIKQVCHKPQKKHWIVRLCISLFFATLAWRAAVKSWKHLDKDTLEVPFEKQINNFFDTTKRDEKRDKAAEIFTEYLKTAPLENYYYNIFIERSEGKKDHISAWKNETHKAYLVEDLYEEPDSPTYKNTQGFWYEKDGCFYGRESFNEDEKLVNGATAEKILSEKMFEQKISWEELHCDEEAQRAKEILLYFAENYQSLNEKHLFNSKLLSILYDIFDTLRFTSTSKFEKNGDEDLSATFGNIVIQKVEGHVDIKSGKVKKNLELTYLDKDQNKFVDVFWEDDGYDAYCETWISRWEDGNLFVWQKQ